MSVGVRYVEVKTTRAQVLVFNQMHNLQRVTEDGGQKSLQKVISLLLDLGKQRLDILHNGLDARVDASHDLSTFRSDSVCLLNSCKEAAFQVCNLCRYFFVQKHFVHDVVYNSVHLAFLIRDY